jgi:hypothetical protein
MDMVAVNADYRKAAMEGEAKYETPTVERLWITSSNAVSRPPINDGIRVFPQESLTCP